MNWWEVLHLALSASVFVTVFGLEDHEPLTVRTLTAVVAALFWLPLLIIFAIWMIGDGIGGLLRVLRR